MMGDGVVTLEKVRVLKHQSNPAKV